MVKEKARGTVEGSCIPSVSPQGRCTPRVQTNSLLIKHWVTPNIMKNILNRNVEIILVEAPVCSLPTFYH